MEKDFRGRSLPTRNGANEKFAVYRLSKSKQCSERKGNISTALKKKTSANIYIFNFMLVFNTIKVLEDIEKDVCRTFPGNERFQCEV